MLLLPPHFGIPLGLVSVSLCAWACWHVMNRRPGVWRLVLVASVIAFFWPILWFHMDSIEFWSMVFTGVFQGIGTIVFVNKSPNPWPKVFGYHEIFHIFTILGMICIFLCNWSVIRRTCNPYARHTNIFEYITHAINS